MGRKAALRRIDEYTRAKTTPFSEVARELFEDSIRTFEEPAMSCGPVVGAFLQTLIAATGAKRVLEIGMYAGFSALMMAEALPEGGELITCEIEPDKIEFARRHFARSPDGHKITIREGPAIETVRTLGGPFDFVFIDADKQGYLDYYEAVLPILRPNGLIACDDVLLGSAREPTKERSRAMVAFLDRVRSDDRVSQVVLTVRHGISLIRKL